MLWSWWDFVDEKECGHILLVAYHGEWEPTTYEYSLKMSLKPIKC